MPKAAAGRGENTTAASAVIPKRAPIFRMTWHLKKLLRIGHQRALLAIGSYGLRMKCAKSIGRMYLRVITSRMSAFGGKADIERLSRNWAPRGNIRVH